jgi:rhomboid family GlyGly-CTERM serine protease
MGLALAGETSSRGLGWGWPLALAAAAVALEMAGFREHLRWDRLAIGGGEFWRLAGGHLVHLGWSHLLMNVLGLVLVWSLVGAAFSAKAWGVVVAVSIASIDAGFWWLSPGLDWYVGLSGVLHALLAAGAVNIVWRHPERRLEAGALILLLAGKLAFEQLAGPMPGSNAAAGGAVVVDAHLYGALAGCGAAFGVTARTDILRGLRGRKKDSQ